MPVSQARGEGHRDRPVHPSCSRTAVGSGAEEGEIGLGLGREGGSPGGFLEEVTAGLGELSGTKGKLRGRR